MMTYKLIRGGPHPDGTFGVLLDEESRRLAVTIERPWVENRPDDLTTPGNDASCIPLGTYLCKRVMSPSYGETFEIEGIPGRTLVRFHWGNTIEDTLGCILVGNAFGTVQGKPAVIESRAAFATFMNSLHDEEEFLLEVDGPPLYEEVRSA